MNANTAAFDTSDIWNELAIHGKTSDGAANREALAAQLNREAAAEGVALRINRVGKCGLAIYLRKVR